LKDWPKNSFTAAWATPAGSEAADIHSRIVDRVEREVIAQVLHECAGVQIKAASRLGINRNTLHKKLKQYGLDGE
jgi:DNA-binding protein Fis